MAELVIIIGHDKNGILDGLRVKSELEKMGLDVVGVITKKTKDKDVPYELIESLLKAKVLKEKGSWPE